MQIIHFKTIFKTFGACNAIQPSMTANCSPTQRSVSINPATVEGDREAELEERPLKQTARRQHNTVDGQHRLRFNT